MGVERAQLLDIGQAGLADGGVPDRCRAGLRPENVCSGILHGGVGRGVRRAVGGEPGQAALCGGKAPKAFGQIFGICQKTALPSDAVVGENRVQKVEPVAVQQQLKVKGPVLGPDAVRQEADAGLLQKGPPDAVFPDRPVPGGVQGLQPRGVVAAGKRAGHQMQTVVRGQRAVGLPFEMPADEPVAVRVGGQRTAQLRQQAGGHGVVTVEKQQPVACGGLEAGVARRGKAAVFPVNDLQAGQLGGEGVAHRAALVGGAVVHKDALPVARAGLLDHAFDAGGQVVLHVVDGDDDGKERHKCLLAIKPSPEEGRWPEGPDEGRVCAASC